MAATLCSALTRAGHPCRALARPGSACCPFHDPATADLLAAGRRKRGSKPNRRPSRRRLAARGADLLCRLNLTAMDRPETLDTTRLQALAELAPVFLAALERSAS